MSARATGSDVNDPAPPGIFQGERIVAGDPRGMNSGEFIRRGAPSSFSRFVLPLAYQLTPWDRAEPRPDDARFEEATAQDWLHSPVSPFPPQKVDYGSVLEASLDRERENYFTRETSRVLFQNTRWFMLRNLGTTRFNLRVKRGDAEARVTVNLRPPALLLFEFRTPPGEPTGGSLSVLPQAMFVIEAWWEPGEGDTAPRLDDVLVFNELFRYFQRPFERHSRLPAEDGNKDHNYLRELGDLPVDWRGEKPLKLKHACTPDEDGDQTQSKDRAAGKDPRLACYLERWEWLLDCPVRVKIPRQGNAGASEERYYSVVPGEWLQNARKWALGEIPYEDAPAHGWLLYADNRAFVWTCAVMHATSPLLYQVRRLSEDIDEKVGTKLGYWLRLVNMDPLAPNPDTCTAFEARWAEARTYRRWAHFGALQGFNYHGGAMLTGPCDEPPTWRHFGAMYFDQALLLLYLRVTIFRISYELSNLSIMARRKGNDEQVMDDLARQFGSLSLDFAFFTNLYQFPLLSNQQQGIELYALCREQMDVQKLFEEVRDEVMATHELLELRAQTKMSKAQTELAELSGRLTVVATVGLLAGLVLSALGMSDYATKWLVPIIGNAPNGWRVLAVVAVLAIVFVLLLGVTLFFSNWLLRVFKRLADPSPPNLWLSRSKRPLGRRTEGIQGEPGNHQQVSNPKDP